MSIRSINSAKIQAAVIDAIGEIFCQPQAEVISLLKAALDGEKDEIARDMLSVMIENSALGFRDKVPVCQDTGLLIVFASLGADVHIAGGCLQEILDSAAAQAWQKYYLRNSIAYDPLLCRGSNSVFNHPLLPVILHLEQVPGDRLTLHIALKGGGAENCSILKMFDPTASAEEVEDYIVQSVVSSGGKPCPPLIVGVGIGGDFELCALLAKKALIVNPNIHNTGDVYREMEHRLLDRINRLGKGVQGFAGSTTALEVRILTAPCHIASLPVAVNLECHSHRCTSREI